jgi:hypothetical protein
MEQKSSERSSNFDVTRRSPMQAISDSSHFLETEIIDRGRSLLLGVNSERTQKAR